MPHQAEGNANNVLGNLLRPMLGKAEVFFESTRVIAGQSGKRPDILITSPGRSPVVIEAEYDPARTVEQEARERLGMTVESVARPIEAAIALRYPAGVDDAYDQRAVIADAALSYCVFTVERYSADTRRAILGVARFPESGWLQGGVADLVRRKGAAEGKLLTLARFTHWFDSATIATLVASPPQLKLRYLIAGKRHD